MCLTRTGDTRSHGRRPHTTPDAIIKTHPTAMWAAPTRMAHLQQTSRFRFPVTSVRDPLSCDAREEEAAWISLTLVAKNTASSALITKLPRPARGSFGNGGAVAELWIDSAARGHKRNTAKDKASIWTPGSAPIAIAALFFLLPPLASSSSSSSRNFSP
jgi:hypothetical protein